MKYDDYLQMHKKWYEIRSLFGERRFFTYSDVGSVLVGNSDFGVFISNGIGDGKTRVAIFDKSIEEDKEIIERLDKLMNYEGMIAVSSDNVGIFGGDTDFLDDQPIRILQKGRYFTYSFQGLVAFIKLIK